MPRNFVLISLMVICIFLQSTRAATATFECVDVPAVCKAQFGTQFEKGFKEIHLNAVRNLLKTFIESCNLIKSELRNDDPNLKGMEDIANTARKNLEKFDGNLDDNKKIGEIIEKAMNDMTYTLQYESDSKDFDMAADKFGVKKSIGSVMRKFAIETGNLWAAMYAGLREIDLKTYPEYAEVNELMEILRGNGVNPSQATHYNKAAVILATKFNLPYFETVAEIN